MSHSDWSRPAFEPQAHEPQLAPLIADLIERPPEDQRVWRKRLKAYPKAGGGLFAKADLLAGFRAFAAARQWPISESDFISLLKLRPTRTLSGVTPVTVLTKPFPCPGQCIFCPNDVRMPKSYLSEEPGALQAAYNRFDPYAQTWNRILSFYDMGHPIDKIEFIILGGSWSAYPRSYQRYFIARCFEAMNDFGATNHPTRRIPETTHRPDFFDLALLEDNTPEPGATINVYNHTVGQHLRSKLDGQLLAEHEDAEWSRIEHAQRRNETARCRVVGLVIETRPDMVSEDEVIHLRRLGATKIQIGIQSMSDDILTQNRRGHDVETSRRALQLLRRAGFKIHAHWMANLFGATIESDSIDFQRLFGDPSICPDELKLYPCALIPKTELMSHYEAGRWTPYTRDELLELLCAIMPKAPVYCRLSRVIRDIPSIAIHAGNQETNFREVVERTLAARQIKLRDIRAREVKRRRVAARDVELREFKYETTVSVEYFLSFETADALLGFCRLSLPTNKAFVDELENTAMIREVHVYGQSLEIGHATGDDAQHKGLGRRLIERATELATEAGYDSLAVISSVGTRAYYRRLNFHDGILYQHRTLTSTSASS